jgi:aerobic-type carbon monoxide dehydrogenase small subunit (CoxS/CutS family)
LTLLRINRRALTPRQCFGQWLTEVRSTSRHRRRGHDLHPLQRKVLEHAALHRGFCTRGLLVAAKALLDRNPDPSETEARYWLAGNLCRCTGYDKVIRAVLDAAAEMRGG